MRFPFRLLILGLLILIVITSLTAVASANTIPSTRLDDRGLSFNINNFKRGACAGLSLTTLVTGSGTLTGTPGNDLILGSSSADTIDGMGGDDCIVSGGGDDSLTGNDGTDVCLGDAGNDTFTSCEAEVQ